MLSRDDSKMLSGLHTSLPASAYVGDYSNDYVGDAKVVDSGGSLFLLLG